MSEKKHAQRAVHQANTANTSEAPQREEPHIMWNQLPSKHKKVSVYLRRTSELTFEGRPELTRHEEHVTKLFRGSPKAFELWKLTHTMPAAAEVFYE